MDSLEQVKAAEQALHDRFMAACQVVLDLGAAIRRHNDDVYHAGGSPGELLHMADVLAAVKQLLDRQGYQARILAHREDKAAILAARSPGRTFGIKQGRSRS